MPNEDGWLLDSVYNYEKAYGNYKTIWKITERNNYDLPLTKQNYEYDFEMQEFIPINISEFEYVNEADSNEYYHIWSTYNNGVPIKESRLYTYHEENGYETFSTESWDGEYWVNGHKERYNLNNIYNTIHQLVYYRESELTDWVLHSENKATFNADSTVLFEYIITTVNEVDTISKTYGYYDENKNPYLRINYLKNDDKWEIHYQYKYKYNVNHQIIEFLEFGFEDGQLLKTDSTVYEYDSYGNLASSKNYDWEEDDLFWETGRRYDYVYDENQNLLEYTFYWGYQNTSWRNSDKRIYQYDDQNREIYYANFEATYSDTAWKAVNRINRTYENSYYYVLYEKWNEDLEEYKNHQATENTYDDQNRIIESKIYYAESPSYEMELSNTSNYFYTENDNQYIYEIVNISASTSDTINHKIMYYNRYNTAIKEILQSEYHIAPNPSSNYIHIKPESSFTQSVNCEIYNTLGMLIKNEKPDLSGKIDISNLPTGHFLIKIYTANGKTETHKFQKL
jgi:hypothetical protein